jgi:hypothetical protein
MHSLPLHFFLSVYDPDPIATLRRRRVSNDSVDSGGSMDYFNHRLHPSIQLHQTTPRKESCLVSPNSTTSSTSSPSSSAAKKSSKSSKTAKKHKKKHRKHHHCKHKHKKHKQQVSPNTSGSSLCSEESGPGTLRIKLDGSFNNTTTYSIRSPNTGAAANVYGQQPADSQEEEEDEDDDSGEEDEDEESRSDESSSEEEQDKSVRRSRETWAYSLVLGASQ